MNVFDWEQFDEHERVRTGDEAEIRVRQVISSHEHGVILRGPLISHINEQNQMEGFRETDFLVYTQGNVFCVEVKYYSGTVTYLSVPGGYDDDGGEISLARGGEPQTFHLEELQKLVIGLENKMVRIGKL